MGFTKIVEVTSISRATESSTGDSIFLVHFGEEVKVSPELQKHLSQPQSSMPPKKVYSNVMQVYFDFDGVAPYKIGSKWKLEIGLTGKLTLNEIK